MLYIKRVPKPPLDAYVASIWYCQSPPRQPGLERVLPSGGAQLIVNLKEDRTRMYHPGGMTTAPGALLSGVATRYSVIDTAEQECVAGVAFRPGGTVAFFAVPAHELRDRDLPLEFLWGRQRTAGMRARLLEAASPTARLDVLEEAMAERWMTPCLHPAVRFALHTFESRPELVRIAAVADEAGLSAKRFIERFKMSVGVTPKSYCRIVRFQRVLAQAEAGRRLDWTRIAMDCGYFDQAHLIRDFRSFAGMTPTGYDAGRTQFRNHVKFVQSAAAIEVG